MNLRAVAENPAPKILRVTARKNLSAARILSLIHI